MTNIYISVLKNGRNEVLSEEDIMEINGLLLELSPKKAKELSENDIRAVIQNGVLFLARENTKAPRAKIVGMASLLLLRKLSDSFVWVEDVVVAESCRGQGIGKHLMQAILDYEWPKGVQNPSMIELTSNPSREAANKLYQTLGFERYETNVYRKKMKSLE